MENLTRLIYALSIFFIMVVWETFKPRRIQKIPRRQRWPVNLGLALFNMALMRVSIGALAYSSAVFAANQGFGVLNVWHLPNALTLIITIITLDLAIYAQHLLMHHWPLLWRLHKVHHTDLEFDATTAVRFHPLEILLSMFYKVACIIVIGGNPEAIVMFEIILNGAATFNHSNIMIPTNIDKMLRWLIITPDMHRIHHSTNPKETNSNYGFSISCWDRVFNTYIPEPQLTQIDMKIGIKSFRQQTELTFMQCLLIPFKPKSRLVE